MTAARDPVFQALRSGDAARIFRRHAVEDAFLFGSRATGKATTESDVDVAIRFAGTGDGASRLDRLAAVETDLKSLLEAPADFICLNDASPLLAFEAVVRGQSVYAPDPDRSFLHELLVRHRYEEYLHVQAIFIEALKRRLGVA
jgi:predicted nucleotidyltransferase